MNVIILHIGKIFNSGPKGVIARWAALAYPFLIYDIQPLSHTFGRPTYMVEIRSLPKRAPICLWSRIPV